jgi:adenylosuccinate lyase
VQKLKNANLSPFFVHSFLFHFTHLHYLCKQYEDSSGMSPLVETPTAQTANTLMELDILTAVSPIDGRYHSKTASLAPYFSEYALMKYRLRVEIEYFIALCELPLPQLKGFDHHRYSELRHIYQDFTETDAARIKEIESVTNHDVKAIEYFIKEQLDKLGGYDAYKEFIHFGLTSQDINNTSFPMMLKESLEEVYYPQLQSIIDRLNARAEEWADIPMLAKTHGQPASPTRLGKEIKVFAYRLETQLAQLKACTITAKFGGATGNFNAHHVAYPAYDWKQFADKFVKDSLHLQRESYTTQISNYDNLAAVFDAMKRIHTILIDLDRDFWQYISMEYFKQRIKAGEVGSSAMPHKVNPIDFENSEGNLGIANALLEHLSRKLPISRLQRDLTDSTVIRNIGVPMGHALIAFQSTIKGIDKLLLHEESLQADLEKCWAVVAEAIQTILRREAYPHPYEALKALTRTNAAITHESIQQFIDTLEVSDTIKEELRAITPHNYTGI